jgi:hypothetical protein
VAADLTLGYKRQHTPQEARQILDDAGFIFHAGQFVNLQSFCRTEKLPSLIREMIYRLFLLPAVLIPPWRTP